MKGTVNWYNRRKGYGFIEQDHSSENIYVHYTGLTSKKPLQGGDRVEYDVETTERGDKAVNVAVI